MSRLTRPGGVDKATRATCPALSVSPVSERLSELALTLALDEFQQPARTLGSLLLLGGSRSPSDATAATALSRP